MTASHESNKHSFVKYDRNLKLAVSYGPLPCFFSLRVSVPGLIYDKARRDWGTLPKLCKYANSFFVELGWRLVMGMRGTMMRFGLDPALYYTNSYKIFLSLSNWCTILWCYSIHRPPRHSFNWMWTSALTNQATMGWALLILKIWIF